MPEQVVLHEILHLLGCCSPWGAHSFVHDDTTTARVSQYGQSVRL